MGEVCANCACRLDDNCCGDGKPYELGGIAYCCRACAEDGECTCGCQTMAGPAGKEEDRGGGGPVLSRVY